MHETVLNDPIKKNLVLFVCFSVIYYLLSKFEPASFNKKLSVENCIYFSVITQTTVGFGDINPVSLAAKLVCCVHVILSLYWNVIEPLEQSRKK